MKSIVPFGFLVAVEGIDGAGKTTVSALLAQYCGERGILATFSKEPTGLKYGQQLRESAKAGRLSAEEELDLFIKDREDHVDRVIAPSLEEGSVVILDRYYWSTAAYQGARGLDAFNIVAKNEEFAPIPDLFLLLDVDAKEGLRRISARGDAPNAFEREETLDVSRSIFRSLHDARPENAVVIDASKSMREVVEASRSAFLKRLIAKIAKHDLTPSGVNRVLQLLGGDHVPEDQVAA